MAWLHHEDQTRKYLDVCLILKMLDMDLLHDVLWLTETQAIRRRSMPPLVIFCHGILRWLDGHASDEEILRHIHDGLAWLNLHPPRRARTSSDEASLIKGPGKSALSQARTRLGSEPFAYSVNDICRPIHSPARGAAAFRQWLGASFDTTSLRADRRAIPASELGANPDIKLTALVEHGTNVLFGSSIGESSQDNLTAGIECVRKLNKEMICLGGVETFGFSLYRAASSECAQIIWQVPHNLYLPYISGLPDGTYISHLYGSSRHHRLRIDREIVRVIEFSSRGAPPGERIRLITSLLDHHTAPAKEIAAFFRSRRTIRQALDASRIKDLDRDISLRSRTPDLVRQEIYSLLLAHFLCCDLLREQNERRAGLLLVSQNQVRIVRRRAKDIDSASCQDDNFLL